jgi:predicted nucleotidyltransferase
MTLPHEVQAALDRVLASLQATLGGNLHSLVLYGSAVRGNFVAGKSDLNLLIVLQESTPEAHSAVAEAIRGPIRVEPIVIGRRGMERSFQSFALKFRSIRRSYRVLHGPDPLAIDVDPTILKFLCEQALRNYRMRLVHAFVTMDRKRYSRFLLDSVPALFTALAEVLRVEGIEIPSGFTERIPIIERGYDVQAPVLQELLRLRAAPAEADAADLHAQVFRLVDRAVLWVESRWPK